MDGVSFDYSSVVQVHSWRLPMCSANEHLKCPCIAKLTIHVQSDKWSSQRLCTSLELMTSWCDKRRCIMMLYLCTEKGHHFIKSSGGFKGAPPSPLRPKIFSISCSFRENLAKSYVGRPRGSAPPPTGNPGSAPEENHLISRIFYSRYN